MHSVRYDFVENKNKYVDGIWIQYIFCVSAIFVLFIIYYMYLIWNVWRMMVVATMENFLT